MLNVAFVQNAMDSEGKPIDAGFYRTFWGLQQAFQHPVETSHPDAWTKMVKDLRVVLAEFNRQPVAVSGRAPSAGTPLPPHKQTALQPS